MTLARAWIITLCQFSWNKNGFTLAFKEACGVCVGVCVSALGHRKCKCAFELEKTNLFSFALFYRCCLVFHFSQQKKKNRERRKTLLCWYGNALSFQLKCVERCGKVTVNEYVYSPLKGIEWIIWCSCDFCSCTHFAWIFLPTIYFQFQFRKWGVENVRFQIETRMILYYLIK